VFIFGNDTETVADVVCLCLPLASAGGIGNKKIDSALQRGVLTPDPPGKVDGRQEQNLRYYTERSLHRFPKLSPNGSPTKSLEKLTPYLDTACRLFTHHVHSENRFVSIY